MRFLFPPGGTTESSPLQWKGPSPLPQRCAGIRTGRGPKAPGQRPPRPRRALRTHRVGRWPLCLPDLPVYRAPSRASGETRCVSCSRLEGRQNPHRCNGRGHRPCHSAAPGSGPAGGPKPPASARPAHGGRFAPAGSGAGLPLFPDLPVYRAPLRRGEGNAGRVSCSRPNRRRDLQRFIGRGHRPCHRATPGSGPAGGQSPRPAPAPPPAGASHPPGRALASVLPGPADLQGTVAQGRGKRGSRFLFPPGGAIALSPPL